MTVGYTTSWGMTVALVAPAQHTRSNLPVQYSHRLSDQSVGTFYF